MEKNFKHSYLLIPFFYIFILISYKERGELSLLSDEAILFFFSLALPTFILILLSLVYLFWLNASVKGKYKLSISEFLLIFTLMTSMIHNPVREILSKNIWIIAVIFAFNLFFHQSFVKKLSKVNFDYEQEKMIQSKITDELERRMPLSISKWQTEIFLYVFVLSFVNQNILKIVVIALFEILLFFHYRRIVHFYQQALEKKYVPRLLWGNYFSVAILLLFLTQYDKHFFLTFFVIYAKDFSRSILQNKFFHLVKQELENGGTLL
ncbi:hypothetical protein SAMN02745116_02335 [Pilibacter termitis]|uniref:Uncharacterized protein n=1 Tax=Pilibacter termitis TaxID=263852 RepID=A0A1T4QVM1_9ENTE|nr:hypothetical protein [Pilibacter termitis]SKA07676.1 hypothetical protein SAMN02745116_02335 [Pilibacter termitis]